ncbi:MAG: hypothetical protein ABJA82_02825 [Myxococcales bacterium]
MSMTRAEKIPAGFVPAQQIARTAILAVGLLTVAAFVARHARPAAWLLIPAFWVFANFFEWTVHRFPMHRPLVPRMMYRNHAQVHHGAFADDSMAMAEPRELWLIMMPWYTIVLLLVAASPVGIVAALLGGLPLAGIFYIGALSYFLFYETVHALYHVAPEQLRRFGIHAEGNGLFARMRAHHAHHHALRRMAHVNFNVTIPLADTVFGTRERAGATSGSRRPGPQATGAAPEGAAGAVVAAAGGGGGSGRAPT